MSTNRISANKNNRHDQIPLATVKPTLNKQKFAGYKDWRLPILDEAMSLLKPYKSDNDLYIDPTFDQKQKWIWTLDESDAGVSWVVTFRAGCCYVPSDPHYYVRAARGKFWFPGNESLDENALLELIS